MRDEYFLCLRWDRRQYGATSLCTTDGQPLVVVYPGRWCRTPGPDFRDAVLLIGDMLCHGDIEVHNYATAWHGHGHHLQPAYNRVILQVVLDIGRAVAPYTSDGRAVPTLQLPPLPAQAEDTMPPTCPEAAARWGAGSLAVRLEELGQDRVLSRAACLEAEMSRQPPGQVLYSALCATLGYTRNVSPFRELAQRLPLALLEAAAPGCPVTDRSPLLAALLLGESGLLPSQRATGWQPDAGGYARRAEQSWQELASRWGLQPMGEWAWRFAQVRPENRPTRRVAAAAWLVARHMDQGLLAAVCAAVQAGPAALEKALVGGSDVPYWGTHYDFGRPKRASHLIGPARGGEAAVNAAIPTAYAYGQWQGDEALCEAALVTLRQYPARGENELTRYMKREVLRLPIRQTACRQQGLLHLYHRWCRDKNCGECPIADKRM